MKLSVMIKQGDNYYIKARPYEKDFPIPVVGEPYYATHMITSPVVSFAEISNGYEVKTRNSVYHFYIDEMENVEKLVKEKGLPDKVEHESGSFYWGNDNRATTYFRVMN